MHKIPLAAALLVVLVALAPTGFSQDASNSSAAQFFLKVEITTSKKAYHLGEPVEYRVTLVNRGEVQSIFQSTSISVLQ